MKTTRDQVEDISYEKYLKRIEIFHKKNHDYADEDALSNFKRISSICEIWGIDISKPDGVADFYIIVKLDRYFNLKRRGVAPENESLEDTFIIDLPNYIDLSWAIQVEESKDINMGDIEKL